MTKKEKQKIRSARWYEKNRERALQMGRENYAKDPKSHNEKSHLYHQLNRDKMLQKQKEYRLAHLEECRAQGKEWRRLNKAKKAAMDKQYQINNSERVRAINRAWKQKNKARVRASIWKRKALKRAATINLAGIQEWMKAVFSKPLARCYYCDKVISTKRIHIEHIVPLIEGGMHSVENLCVACGPCNLSKGSKPITVWVKPGQQILAL